jgi:hypothetical protein
MDDQRTNREGGELLKIAAKISAASVVLFLLWVLVPVIAVLIVIQAPFMFLAWRYLPKTDRPNDNQSNSPQK